MTSKEIFDLLNGDSHYTLHCHTQFCDGRATMREFVMAAFDHGFTHLGFTPHSPVPIASPCNMSTSDVSVYFQEIEHLRSEFGSRLNILAGMEIDYLSENWGAHIDYFQSLPLDFRLSSIHFVPSQEGEPVDIDGSFNSFKEKMDKRFHGDLDYVVETFFSHSHSMLENGGFEILGHFDKISMNGELYRPGLTQESRFKRLMDDLIDHIASKDIIVEINTKAFDRCGRFFPSKEYWNILRRKGLKIVVNSDAHVPALIDASRQQVLVELNSN